MRLKNVLQERDGYDDVTVDDLVTDFEEELVTITMTRDPGEWYEEATTLISQMFGLEPDYLDDFTHILS